MKRGFAVAAVAVLMIVAIGLLYSPIKGFLWAHPWWHGFFVAVPAMVLGILEVLHGREASQLSSDANESRAEANRLRAELNKSIQEIAKNSAKAPSRAERNADTLRGYLGKQASVTRDENMAPVPMEIVDVSDDHIVTLFVRAGFSSSSAYRVQADCGDVEIDETPAGGCALRIKVLKIYGTPVQLGQAKKWEDVSQAAANPSFAKGTSVCQAWYEKPGSSEKRSIFVYTDKDDTNRFLLETHNGEICDGSKEQISKKFMVIQIEFQIEGFVRKLFNGPAGLYIC